MSMEKPLPSPGYTHSGTATPPRIIHDDEYQSNGVQLPPISTTFSTSSLAPGSGAASPRTPITPTSPSGDSKSKRSNPLLDLHDTEKLYVEQLTGIIRKVAGAWSRSNLPPPDLDTMFRSIESVYKANRSLYNRLKEIGTNPSSPKPLGDLLMHWIDDLDTPYSNYCSKYRTGFDRWEPVANNARLPGILAAFSESCPPPPPDTVWTLDVLFDLPAMRIRYYQKLYNRLLKSTTPGRSDHKLLVSALERLEGLVATLESRAEYFVGHPSPPSKVADEDEIVISPGRQELELRPEVGSASSSARGSGYTSDQHSNETGNTSFNQGPVHAMSMPITDLERRLSTKHTMDIFTMKPKAVKLQISPPQLTYTRSLRFSEDAVISFTPRSTGQDVVHHYGHIFLLSDLFLVAERMSNQERAQEEADLGERPGAGPDMWLCYPPLSGKVLRVAEVPGQDNIFTVAIMRKETLYIQVDSIQTRDFMLKEFKDCIDLASSVGPVSSQPPPPMPPLPQGLQINKPVTSPPPSAFVESRSASPNQRGSEPLDQRPGSDGSSYSRDGNSQGMLSRGPSLQAQNIQPPPRVSSANEPSLEPPVIPPMRSVSAGPQPVPRGPGPNSPGYPQYAQPPHMGGPPPPPPHTGGPLPPHMGGPPQPHMGGPQIHMGGPPPPPHMGLPPHQQMGGPSMVYPGDMPPNNHMNGPGQHRGPPGPNGPHGSLGPHMRQGLPDSPGPSRAPSRSSSYQASLRKSPSTPSLGSQEHYQHLPPLPSQFGAPLHAPQPKPLLPSAAFNQRIATAMPSFDEPSPPGSPVEEVPPQTGPVSSRVSVQIKCKVFLKQQHAQWKSLGGARLKLYHESPTNIKQLVVEADSKSKSVLISTLILTDGVERVGKTGVAVELSDRGQRTGIVYMIQTKGEKYATELFDGLLAGSDRA